MSDFVISNSNSAGNPTVTALADGKFVVAWQTTVAANIGLTGRVYNADGSPSSAEFSIETAATGSQTAVTLIALPTGGFVAAWQSTDATGADTSGNAIRARVFSSDGTAAAADFVVNTSFNESQNAPGGTVLADGRILLTWNSADGAGADTSDNGIRGIILNADGTPSGSDFVINTVVESSQLAPSATALADGGYVIVWTSMDALGSDTGGGGIRATRFDAAGNAVGTADFEVNTSTAGIQASPRVDALPDGGYVVTWRSADSGDSDVRARIFGVDGAPTGDDFVVNSTTDGNQFLPSVTTLDDGRIFMAWSSPDNPAVIRGRVLEGNGTAVGDDFVVNMTHGTTAAIPTVSTLDDGSVVVTWRATFDGITTIMGTTLDLTGYEGNTSPTGLALSDSTVEENSALGTVIGELSATDGDGDALTYTLTNDVGGKFALVMENGVTKLVVAAALDHESAMSHDVAVKVSDGRGGEKTATFAVAVTDVDDTEEPTDPRGTITIDASGSQSMDFEAYIRGGFAADTTSGGFPVFDNSAAFSGEEMFIGYGTEASSKYVLMHGALEYHFATHTVAGTADTIEYGTVGSGTYDADGYFAGGSVELRITGLDLSNPTPANPTEEAEIEANGEIHNFATAHMYGAPTTSTQPRYDKFGNTLDAYAQNYIGSSGTDKYTGTRFDDVVAGNAGEDLLAGGGGSDEIDGGEGADMAIYTGNNAGYSVVNHGNGTYTVTDNRTGTVNDGTDTLKGIEYLMFADGMVDVSDYEPENQPPTDIQITNTSMLESARIGFEVGVLTATDPEGDAVTWSLVSDTNDNGMFKLRTNDDGSVSVVLRNALDHETSDGGYTLEVMATDAEGNEFSKTFEITAEDDPFKLSTVPTGKDYTSIVESAPKGTDIGYITQFDASFVPTKVKLLDNSNGAFTIEKRTVLDETRYYIVTNKALDFEKLASHEIVVQATDANGNKAEKTFDVQVLDVSEAGDEARGRITIDAATALAAENGGMNWNTFMERAFETTGNSFPSFVGGGGWSPEDPASEYVFTDRADGRILSLEGSDLVYTWNDPESGEDVHVISGNIDNITFGSEGVLNEQGTWDFTKTELTISGLDLSNDVNLIARIDGEVNILTSAFMYGSNYGSESWLQFVKAVLSSYAQDFLGSDGTDRFIGTIHDDTAKGGAGADIFKGGAGDDVITGGGGMDKLLGGADADAFVFEVGDAARKAKKADTIYDFAGKDGDVIDLSTIDANSQLVENQAFDFIGKHGFTRHAGELRYVKEKSDTWIQGDTNGDGRADFVIHLDDAMKLRAEHFNL